MTVFEACRQAPETAAWTIEIYPDKKMRVGSLQTPREYDGRLPLDVDYYLDLVIPRKEEPPKKIGGHARLLHGRISRNKVIDLQSIPEYW